MSGAPPIPAFDMLFGYDPEDHDAPNHLFEVLSAMPVYDLRTLMADVLHFERTGTLTEAIADTFRRAACHADAERIDARLALAAA